MHFGTVWATRFGVELILRFGTGRVVCSGAALPALNSTFGILYPEAELYFGN